MGSIPVRVTMKKIPVLSHRDFFMISRPGIERPTRRSRVKSVRWTLFRPWEIPISSERSPEDCGQKKSLGCSNVLVKGQFPIAALSIYRNIFRTEKAAPGIFRGGHILFHI